MTSTRKRHRAAKFVYLLRYSIVRFFCENECNTPSNWRCLGFPYVNQFGFSLVFDINKTGSACTCTYSTIGSVWIYTVICVVNKDRTFVNAVLGARQKPIDYGTSVISQHFSHNDTNLGRRIDIRTHNVIDLHFAMCCPIAGWLVIAAWGESACCLAHC